MEVKQIKLFGWTTTLTFDKIVLFFFLIINVGLYYDKYLFLIQPAYALLFIGFVNKLISKRKLIYKRYLILSLLFALLAYFSSLWANDPILSSANSSVLLKYVLLSIMLISLLDKIENVQFALKILAIAGLIYTLLYLAAWDVSTLGSGRAQANTLKEDAGMPNVNVVALVVSNSFICFLFFYFHNKSKFALALASVAFVCIFFLGSRKSIVFILLGALMIFLRLTKYSKLNLAILLVIFFQLLLLFIPDQYFSFIWNRFGDLKFISTVSKLDYSDQLRVDFAIYSAKYFSNNPFWGHGYFNFSSLFLKDKSVSYYSHNNFLETAVGLGVVGIALYYSLYFLIVKNIGWPKKLNLPYLILLLLGLNLLNHFFIVVTNDRFTWMLLPILYSGARLIREKASRNKDEGLLNKNLYTI